MLNIGSLLGKIKDTADKYNFYHIFIKANEKTKYTMEVKKR